MAWKARGRDFDVRISAPHGDGSITINSEDTIEEVKIKIEREFNIPSHEWWHWRPGKLLIYDGINMFDCYSVSHYGIQPGGLIQVLPNLASYAERAVKPLVGK